MDIRPSIYDPENYSEDRELSNNKVPGPTIRGTYNTYEDRTRKDLVEKLGHVVDIELENLVQIEVGGWGTNLRMKCAKGIQVFTKINEAGETIIRICPENQIK